MKLKKEFIMYNSGDEQIMVATGSMTGRFSGLVRSNETAAFIVEQLKKDTTEEKIVEAILEKYDASRDVAEKDVKRVLEQLKGIGAIEG